MAGLTDSIGTGVTLFGLLAVLFTLLVNALLKTSSKSDEIAARLVSQKDEVIADKDRQLTAKDSELEHVRQERDYWFGKYDECRGAGRPTP